MNRLPRTSKTHGPKGRHASDSPPSPLAAMTTDTEHIVGLLLLEQSQMLHTKGKSRRVSVCYILENWTLFMRFRLVFPLMTVIHTSFCCTVKNYKLSKIFWDIRAHLRYCTASKDALENCQTTANDDIITDVLHNACSLSRHQSQQYGSWEDTKGQIQGELWIT